MSSAACVPLAPPVLLGGTRPLSLAEPVAHANGPQSDAIAPGRVRRANHFYLLSKQTRATHAPWHVL